jgi:DNA mismatch endonuclease (patch repair protein)
MIVREKEVTYKIMSAIKSKNTQPEILLGKELYKLGLRYRKHYKIFGKPDFVFVKKRIAIFVDGDFWHGNNWQIRGLSSFNEELKNYSIYWQNKIVTNVNRDKKVNSVLRKDKWHVLRFWESEIKRDPMIIASIILKKYQNY